MTLLCLVGCRSTPPRSSINSVNGSVAGHHGPCPPGGTPYPSAKEDPSTRDRVLPGGLYRPSVKDRSPGVSLEIGCIPEPTITDEPPARFGNQSTYTVLGRRYTVLSQSKGYVGRGLASYYGVKFHGRLTSNHEVYDMYALTAAHRTLPLPSFALVTNMETGASVIVRINDRGPFHPGRIIDLSYAAALKLGIVERGTGYVEVRALTKDDMPLIAARHRPDSQALAANSTKLSPSAPPTLPPSLSNMAVTDKALQLSSTDPSSRLASKGAAPGAVVQPVAVSQPQTLMPIHESQNAVAAQQLLQPDVSTPRHGREEPQGWQGIHLQVASFAVRANAERALAQLVSAGIGARLLSSNESGHGPWRVSVFAPDRLSALYLAKRIASLGFEPPQMLVH